MEESQKVIISVIGRDQVGIIAGISAILAESNINILDISQTILQGFFTMVMVVDSAGSTIDIAELRDILKTKGEQMHLEINVQHEDIFKFMHRI
ncbi:MAG TPA: ACT domain-containing protein [Syntrophomonas sp.]|jgi:ACT domain-containing protein|nr:ACT domain-containing protein [Syntrophomonas sp.]HCF70391.1 ACT domain-containing protein [Syntrophomonas sp.]